MLDDLKLSYCFYSVKKDEDADPVVVKTSKNGKDYILITAADGLGGSGCELVNINKKAKEIYYDTITDDIIIDNTLKCIMSQNGLITQKEYLDLLFDDLNENNEYTNAYLASRLVIFRFVDYLVSNIDMELDDDNKSKIISFIKNRIDKLKDKLKIEKKSKVGNISILPTTLVSIRYNKTNNTIDVIWAGDSRAYILTKNGLFQLSKDDENESGSMTNNFSYNRNTILNTRTFNLDDFTDDNRFILFCSSDGFFDPFSEYDFLFDEYYLLHYFENHNSLKDALDNMKKEFEEYYFQDDITISLYSNGFDNLTK